jgi:RNA polymerase sigma factor (sigma-70 family)
MRQPDRGHEAPATTTPEARLEHLVRDYARLVRHAIRSAGGGLAAAAAEDIEQNVFMALWQQVRREQAIDWPVSYIYQAAVRETVKALGRIRRRREVSDEGLKVDAGVSDRVPTPEQQLLRREQARRLEAAVAGLQPDRSRAVRAHLRGFSVQEIMALYGWDYQKARNLVARGMADLRAALSEMEER